MSKRSVLRLCAQMDFIREEGHFATIVVRISDDRAPGIWKELHTGDDMILELQKNLIVRLTVLKHEVPLWKELHTGDDMILELRSVREK